jgi:serine/threonine protein kinase
MENEKKKDKKTKSSKSGKSKNKAKKAEGEQNSTSEWRVTDFERLSTLGTGTFGRVYLVQRESQYYAMKILRKSVVVRLKQVQHIYNERNVLQNATDCPFIVKL